MSQVVQVDASNKEDIGVHIEPFKLTSMKKSNLIISSIALVGQVIGFVGIFVANGHNQLMLSLNTFLLFGCIGGLSLILDSRRRV